MAKQQGSGVVAAAARVSGTQGRFENLGGRLAARAEQAFSKNLEKKKERESSVKENLARANQLMSQFKDDVDYLSYSPEEQKIIKNKVVGWRNEFANIANAAAKIEDKTGAQYQEYVDQMNTIRNRVQNLAKSSERLKEVKLDFKSGLDNNDFSMAGFNDDAIAKGTVISAMPIAGVDDNGDLIWEDEGLGTVNLSSFERPASIGPVKVAAQNIFNEIERQGKSSGKLDENQLQGLRNQIDGYLGNNNNVVLSLIADNQMPAYGFGDIDPEDPTAREQVLDRLMVALKDTRGSLLKSTQDDSLTSAQRNAAADRKKVDGYFSTDVPSFSLGDFMFFNQGDSWAVMESSGLPKLAPNGQPIQARTKEEIYAILGL